MLKSLNESLTWAFSFLFVRVKNRSFYEVKRFSLSNIYILEEQAMNESKNWNENGIYMFSDELEEKIDEVARKCSDLIFDVYYDGEDDDEITDEDRKAVCEYVWNEVMCKAADFTFKRELEKAEREAKEEEES